MNQVEAVLQCESASAIDRFAGSRHLDTSSISFEIENKWNGIVQKIEGQEIHTRLTDPETNDQYELTFPLLDLEEDERALANEGSLFNFLIGYDIKNGTKTNATLIKFRRRKVTPQTIDLILEKMKELDINSLIVNH